MLIKLVQQNDVEIAINPELVSVITPQGKKSCLVQLVGPFSYHVKGTVDEVIALLEK